ncbi:hypothetical protein BDW42DRAFT_164539 [Aspergillus taichungensis]|uniref:Uncharacterized protein n=1 Tax=Aspergillus taichungensis TaxID=482145 RepID=A0A2J5I131_9EURO|nr:hypothetical protein BDW42DRAFT_164539 [Aspergillus taichungensis]
MHAYCRCIRNDVCVIHQPDVVSHARTDRTWTAPFAAGRDAAASPGSRDGTSQRSLSSSFAGSDPARSNESSSIHLVVPGCPGGRNIVDIPRARVGEGGGPE